MDCLENQQQQQEHSSPSKSNQQTTVQTLVLHTFIFVVISPLSSRFVYYDYSHRSFVRSIVGWFYTGMPKLSLDTTESPLLLLPPPSVP